MDLSSSPNLVCMALNSIMEFLFEAMKKDSSLAALLVKSTKLLPSLFQLLAEIPLMQEKETRKNLLILLSDKIVKLLHISLLHP